GTADEKINNSVDEKTGLPIVSLYSESRRPRAEDLTDLDAVVIDLQDAGCRFYTYLATMGYMMEEAAKAKIRVVVLDRPNPIGADRYEGPLADAGKTSFISYHNIPIRTGMTIGELARMFNKEKNINCKLDVVAMKQYYRDFWYDETGLPWTNPSPNLRSVSATLLYPGLCLLEFTNISVGRGTDSPFLQFGAPWIDGQTVVLELGKRDPPGVRFLPVRFTPSSSQYTNQECGGVRIEITNRALVEPVALGFEISCILRDLYKNEWDRKRFGELLANEEELRYFEMGVHASAFPASWKRDSLRFGLRRSNFLLYSTRPPIK
ncbi:MAG: exo-beta-N-acetylmuramidase NamZ domain-containing protein, partial [Planctomycetota bacterium]